MGWLFILQNTQQPYLFKEEEMRPFMLFMLLLDLFLKDVMSAPFGQFIRAAVKYCQKTTCVKSYDYEFVNNYDSLEEFLLMLMGGPLFLLFQTHIKCLTMHFIQ